MGSHPHEKHSLFLPPMPPPPVSHVTPQIKKRLCTTRLLALFWTICFFCYITRDCFSFDIRPQREHETLCPQAEVLIPVKNGNLWDELTKKIRTDDFKSRAIDWLVGAVKIPTESYDGMKSVGQDTRWDVFSSFHNYLLGAYPLIHSNLNLTKVNTYGLFYEWQGSDTSLKPILLAAHQDVVPVEPSTVDKWTYPPYSGYFDGKRIWGRGTSDDKNGLIGIMSSLELLLENTFQPTRTIVIAVGFDEEASGSEGAGTLAPILLNKYGNKGFLFIVDEGDGFSEQYGGVFATPGIAEKGYLDVLVEISAPGGHSSIPPAHTTIGILSSLLVNYEAHPYNVHLDRDDPFYTTLQCYAEFGEGLSPHLRKTIKKSLTSNKALDALQAFVLENPIYKSLVGTTQAIDLVHGGLKSNTLPEQASAVVNHRISIKSSISEVQAHNTRLLAPIASKFNLSYVAFGTSMSEEGAPSQGSLTLSNAFYNGLEPAPVTPVAAGAAPYELLSGTIKATYNSHRSLNGPSNIHIAPGVISGNSARTIQTLALTGNYQTIFFGMAIRTLGMGVTCSQACTQLMNTLMPMHSWR